MTELTQLLADTEREIAALTAQEVYTKAQTYHPMAGDLMDRLLCRAATGYVELLETTGIARTLMGLALARAYEVMLLDMVESDEDHTYVLPSEFRARRRNFTRALAEIAVRGPMAVAEQSQWIIGGSSEERTRRGAKHPLILAAWELVQRAVKDTYPLAYEKQRVAHRTAYEKFAERALERSA